MFRLCAIKPPILSASPVLENKLGTSFRQQVVDEGVVPKISFAQAERWKFGDCGGVLGSKRNLASCSVPQPIRVCCLSVKGCIRFHHWWFNYANGEVVLKEGRVQLSSALFSCDFPCCLQGRDRGNAIFALLVWSERKIFTHAYGAYGAPLLYIVDLIKTSTGMPAAAAAVAAVAALAGAACRGTSASYLIFRVGKYIVFLLRRLHMSEHVLGHIGHVQVCLQQQKERGEGG